MKLVLLGTGSGFPLQKRHHISFVVQEQGRNYLFNCGEGCARSAYDNDIDLLKLNAIYISDMSMEKIAGLPNVLFTIRELNKKISPPPYMENPLQVYTPCVNSWRGVFSMIEEAANNSFARHLMLEVIRYQHNEELYRNGITVKAMRNPSPTETRFSRPRNSYGFRINCGDNIITYSGDLAVPGNLETICKEKSNLLLLDSSFSELDDAAKFIADNCPTPGKIGLIHITRETSDDSDNIVKKISDICGTETFITHDGQAFDF